MGASVRRTDTLERSTNSMISSFSGAVLPHIPASRNSFDQR